MSAVENCSNLGKNYDTLLSGCHLNGAYVKGLQTLVMDPTGLLQQSLENTVPHTMMVHQYLPYLVQDLTKSGLTF